MSYQPFNYEPAGWKFFFEYHTVQGLLDTCGLTGLIAAVHRSDSPYWRSNDSAASLKYCKLTSIFCDTLSHVIMWPCCLFPIKTDFFLKSLLGGSLLATTAAASTHMKTMSCQRKNTKRETEREMPVSASTRLVLFSVYHKDSLPMVSYKQDTTRSSSVCKRWMH